MSEKTYKPEQLKLKALPEDGSFDDDSLIRAIVTDAIKNCSLGRGNIADAMTRLVGRKITERMLNSFTAAAAENHRWPHAWTRAFCHVTKDWRLLQMVAERSGLHVITEEEIHLLELGRQYLRRKQVEEEFARLEKLAGGSR